MIDKKNFFWGHYQQYSGWYFLGNKDYQLPSNPSEGEKRIKVLSATEGKLNAVNLFDSCVVSVSLIQLCERFYLVSGLLGFIIEECGADVVLQPLKPAFDAFNCIFKKNNKGQYRFFSLNSNIGEINTIEKQQELFWGCNGLTNSWTPEAKERALLWGVCFANIWENPEACQAQIEYCIKRLNSFIIPEAYRILFSEGLDRLSNNPYQGALQAGYISFSANNPLKASEMLKTAISHSKEEKWSKDWCIDVFKELTFGTGIKIYPGRYDKIAPWINKLWNTDFPKNSEELKEYKKLDLPVEINTDTNTTISKKSQTPLILEPVNIVGQTPTDNLLFKILNFIFSFFGRK